jgi:hypothetical protein
MHARLDRGKIQLLTRTGLDWSHRYPRTIEALRSLSAKPAYLDGELCGLRPDAARGNIGSRHCIWVGRLRVGSRRFPPRSAIGVGPTTPASVRLAGAGREHAFRHQQDVLQSRLWEKPLGRRSPGSRRHGVGALGFNARIFAASP